MVNVVLVHGTTQSAIGFRGLVAALQRRGHRAHTVDIPGGAASTTAEYALLLAAQLPHDLDRPIVVAHSASGLLLPALARHLDARHQVWLAATVPDYRGGRSLLAEIRHDPLAAFSPEWIGVDPTQDPVLATYFLFHDADLATLLDALPTVVGCDLSAVYAETPVDDPADRPSTYVLPSGDRTMTPTWMAHMARERLGIEPTEIPGGHNPYVADPDGIAAIIAGAAAPRA